MTIAHDVSTPQIEQPVGGQLTDIQVAWKRWHISRQRDLAVPHGWLSLTHFQWLGESPAALPGLPGVFSAHDRDGSFVATVFVDVSDGLEPAAGPRAGEPIHGEITAEVAEAGSLLWLRYREVRVELVLRGGRYAVRVRDPQAPELAAFQGIPAFPVDEAWRVTAHFTAFDAPRAITVDTAREDLRQNVTAVGTLSFELDGRQSTLTATRGPDDRLYVSFRDHTNGTKTAPWRVVTVSVPAGDGLPDDGTVVIDFNRAVNLPFAFTEFGTCPAPVPGNDLPLAVTAGELAPVRVTGPAA
jgi:uncharacterized protein